MTGEKESFVFYKSFYDALQDLKEKDRLKIGIMFNLSFFNLKIKVLYKRIKILKIRCFNFKHTIHHMYIKKF